jgi:hypothetical protein
MPEGVRRTTGEHHHADRFTVAHLRGGFAIANGDDGHDGAAWMPLLYCARDVLDAAHGRQYGDYHDANSPAANSRRRRYLHVMR